jgi:hypothetical protein
MSEPSYEEIQQRAYELFLERGCEHGGDAEDWLAAEQELRAVASEVLKRTGTEVAAQGEQTEASLSRPRRKDTAANVRATVSSAS